MTSQATSIIRKREVWGRRLAYREVAGGKYPDPKPPYTYESAIEIMQAHDTQQP